MCEVNHNMLVSASKEDCQVLVDYWKNLATQTQNAYHDFKEGAVVYDGYFDADLIEEQKKRYAERISEYLDNAEKWLDRCKSFDDEHDNNILRAPQNLQPL